MKKEKTITFRISEDVLNEYKRECEKYGYTMSKKIRQFIINDLTAMKNEKTNN